LALVGELSAALGELIEFQNPALVGVHQTLIGLG
jgi:hypothetical protein